ncbi:MULTISPECIES: hypothetical protein [Vibrio]|uniref:hypothetical protein n=1 Tax=Vibrio TaxID=662 RepID=UPI003D1120D9
MNINEFLIVAFFFTGLGIAICLLAPIGFRLMKVLYLFAFKHPKHLKKTKF